MTTRVPYEMLGGPTNVKAYGAVGDGVADDTAAVQAAIATGLAVYFPPGIYKVSTTLTNTTDLVLLGAVGTVFRDVGNEPVARITAATGATIKWAGGNSSRVVDFDPDVAERFALSDIAIQVADTHATSIVRIKGAKWYNFTGPTPTVQIHRISLYRAAVAASANTPGSSSCLGIEFDLTDTVTPRHIAAAVIRDVFAYGLEDAWRVTILNQATPTSGNFFNGNLIDGIYAYKCYRVGHVIAGSTGYDQASMNTFSNWSIQPVAANGGSLATGVVRFVGNVNRNLCSNIGVYDLVSGSRFDHVSQYSAALFETWNTFLNCVEFEDVGSMNFVGRAIGKSTTANRPTLVAAEVGRVYLDTTLDADGKPIWWNGTAWVDATGATV